jgi:hypothetical protein
MIGCCRIFTARGQAVSKETAGRMAGSAAAASISWGVREVCPSTRIVALRLDRAGWLCYFSTALPPKEQGVQQKAANALVS